MIHVFSTGNYITVCGQLTLASFARYLSHGPPIVYLLLKEQILFLQTKIILTALALWGKNSKAPKKSLPYLCEHYRLHALHYYEWDSGGQVRAL
jgi:hypothetical protein